MISPEGHWITPTNAWAVISSYIEPNAICYINLGKVCHASRVVFTSTHLWRQLVPVNEGSNLYDLFAAQVARFSREQRAELFHLWTDLNDGVLRKYPNHEIARSDILIGLAYTLWLHSYVISTPNSRAAYNQLVALPPWQNRLFSRCIVSIRGTLLQYTPFRGDYGVVLAAAYSCTVPHLQIVDQSLRSRREVVLPIVSRRDCLWLADPKLWNDEQIVTAAIAVSWHPIATASKRLRDKWDIGILAVRKSGRALEYLSSNLQQDETIVYAAVETYGQALEHASLPLKNNFNIVARAVHQDGRALKFASELLQNNKEIVTTAVTNNGLALQYSSAALRDDMGVVLRAVEQTGQAFEFASPRIKNDALFVVLAVKIDRQSLNYASGEIQAELRRSHFGQIMN